MNTQTKIVAKNMKTPDKQNGVFVVSAAFVAVGLGLVGIGIDNSVNKERTNYAVEAPAQAQASTNNAHEDIEDFFSSME